MHRVTVLIVLIVAALGAPLLVGAGLGTAGGNELGLAWAADEPVGAGTADEGPIIELVTMGPGTLLWERYGHAAMCVRYPRAPGRDRCYNYGTTNFGEPVTMVTDFLRGRSLFWVSETTPARMIHFYRNRLDRSLWIQRLPYGPEKARAVADMLAENALEQNKYYKYHHYDDNCATRIRDVIDRFSDGVLSQATEPYPYTLREITRRGMAEWKSFSLLTDFPLGRRADRHPSVYEAMHLPFVLRQEITDRMGIEPVQIYQRQGRSFNVTDPLSRWWLFFIALVIGLPALITRFMGRFERVGLALSIVPAGILGLILWSMAIVSELPEIRYNEVVLVLWPLDLALPFLSPQRRVWYARLRVGAIVLAVLLSAIGVLRQPLWALSVLALIPCLVAAFPGRSSAGAAAADDANAGDSSAGRDDAGAAGARKKPASRAKQSKSPAGGKKKKPAGKR